MARPGAPSLAVQAPTAARAAREPLDMRTAHPVIEAYVAGLEAVLTDAERQRLSLVSIRGTDVGDAQRLRYLAADRAVRVFLPAALEASEDPVLLEYARRIRALPPLLNADTDAIARDLVSEALATRARIEGVVADPSRQPSRASSSSLQASEAVTAVSAIHDIDAQARAEYAEALAQYAETYARIYGVSALHADAAAAAAADAVDAASLLADAIERGANRTRMVQLGRALMEDMATAARRRERIPTPKLAPTPKDSEP